MRVSYEERLSLRRRCDCGNNVVLDVRIGGNAGKLMSSEILTSVCRPCFDRWMAASTCSRNGKSMVDTAESENLSMREKIKTRFPGRSDESEDQCPPLGPRLRRTGNHCVQQTMGGTNFANFDGWHQFRIPRTIGAE